MRTGIIHLGLNWIMYAYKKTKQLMLMKMITPIKCGFISFAQDIQRLLMPFLNPLMIIINIDSYELIQVFIYFLNKNQQIFFTMSQGDSHKKWWYDTGNQYWQKTRTTYDGVMSGYGKYSAMDIAFSTRFLEKIRTKYRLNMHTALDCGAGIGRVTIQLLQNFFTSIDLVDQSANLIQKSKQLLKQNPKAKNFYVSGLQQFNYSEKYDCIWIQWVLSQLKNEDAIQFLRKSKAALNQKGMIIVKQNQSNRNTEEDNEDCSYIRTQQLHKDIFKAAGLKILEQQADLNWPQDLYQTKIYALY